MESIKIFIIEDEWMWAEAITSVINKSKDMEVIGESGEAEAALKRIEELKPDIALIDIHLKGKLDGIDVIPMIKEKSPHTKAIIFTIDTKEKNLFSAIKAGAAGYLLKNEINEPGTLIQAIHSVYSNDAFITPAIAKHVLNIIRNIQNDDSRLTTREKEILLLIEQCKTNKEIAQELFIHNRTVANHLNNIFTKLDAKNRLDAVMKAREKGFLDI